MSYTRHLLARCLSDAITVTDFRCRACRHPLGGEESNDQPSIVFIRRGLFVRRQAGDTVVADSSQILFFNPAQPYRISHPLDGGDDCTILTIARGLAEEVVARHAPRNLDRPAALPFWNARGVAQQCNWRMHYELLATVRSGTQLAIDELVLEIVDGVVEAGQSEASRHRARTSRRVRARTIRNHTALAQSAMIAINRDLAQPPGLIALAMQLGCSAYHLSRVFRAVSGSSMRAYLAAARAHAAADAILNGAPGFTELALSLGYVDHSHFTNAFHRQWRMSPSAFRARLGGRVSSRPCGAAS